MSLKKLSLNRIRKDLKALENYEVVLFGSFVEGRLRENSDIDVAVITRQRYSRELLELQKDILGKFPAVYDVRVFELLPLKVKASVMENYTVLYGDPLEISEYFYFWRKMWNDFKHRVEYHKSVTEKIEAISRGKKLKRSL